MNIHFDKVFIKLRSGELLMFKITGHEALKNGSQEVVMNGFFAKSERHRSRVNDLLRDCQPLKMTVRMKIDLNTETETINSNSEDHYFHEVIMTCNRRYGPRKKLDRLFKDSVIHGYIVQKVVVTLNYDPKDE